MTAFRHPIYTYTRDQRALYDIQGALILLGSMMTIFGMLIMYMEFVLVGASMLIIGSLCGLVNMENYYYAQRTVEEPEADAAASE